MKFLDSEMESRVMRALRIAFGPVQPSDAFRRHLSGNLQLAARHKATGEPIIESPSLLSRPAIMIGGAIGLVATMVAVLLYFWEGHKRNSPSSANG